MSKNKIVRASKKHPCIVCDGGGWPCYYFANREVAGCANAPNLTGEMDRNGECYLHVLVTRDRPVQPIRPQPKPKPQPVVAGADHLNLVYGAMLRDLSLSQKRLNDLLRRGLSRRAIEAGSYKDTPTREQADGLTQRLAALGLGGVPGFYMRGECWRMVGCYPGVIVPYRDIEGRIHGLSYRPDVPLEGAKYLWVSTDPEKAFDDGRQKYPRGTKLTPPLHFARPDLIPRSSDILLTEGGLKADCAAALLRVPIIGAGGVTQWGDGFASRFKQLFPDKRAVICYDADWRSNEHVRHALETLMASLRDAGVRYVVRSWPQYPTAKGIDDLALMLSESEVKGVAA
jgi:hypothetical protein